MNKLSKAWLDSQIEQELERGCCGNAVRDLAALLTVRKNMYGDDSMHGKAAGWHSDGHLTKDEAIQWVSGMKRADGAYGGKWKHPSETEHLADQEGMSTEEQKIIFFAVVNAMYSDYCMVAKKHGVDTPLFYADLARAWILDEDANPYKDELYYRYIVQHG